MNATSIMNAYQAAWLHFVRIPRRNGKPTKGPTTPGWNQPRSEGNPHGYTNDRAMAAEWLRAGDNVGLALVPSGVVSLDIDDLDETRRVFDEMGLPLNEWLAAPNRVEIQSGKQGKGKLLFRVESGPVPPSKKLTYGKGKNSRSIFELRHGSADGRTLQDVLPPSVHPDTGRPYKLVGGMENMPVIPPELLALWRAWPDDLLKSFDPEREPPMEAPRPSRTHQVIEGERDPIAEFNEASELETILERHGYRRRGKRYLRPGSESGIPGVTILERNGRKLCYSHGGDNLNDGYAHDAFDVYRILGCGGDWKAALAWNPELTRHNRTRFKEAKASGKDQAGVGGDQGQQKNPDLINAVDLCAKPFEPVKWAVPGLLPAGVTILAGAPKTGKSWLALDLGIAVASGGAVLGKTQVDPGDVLYLALEDNHRRLKGRLLKRLAGGPPPAGLEFATEWARIDQGAVDRLKDWLTARPNARLVVIDTLARIRPPSKGKENIYETDYAVGKALLRLAAEHDVAIVLVHHTRKGDAEDPLELISGSTGLTGGVDNVLVLRRTRGTDDATLFVTGRDIENETEYGLSWDSRIAAWRVTGEGPHVGLSPERRKVFDIIANHGTITGADVARRLNPGAVIDRSSKEFGAARRILAKLVESGLIVSTAQGYLLANGNTHHTGNPGNTGNTGNTGGCVTASSTCVTETMNAGNTLKPTADAASGGLCYRVTCVTDTEDEGVPV